MLIVLSIVLAAVVLLVLAYPIIRNARGTAVAPMAVSAEENLDELLAQRDAAFQAIRDLQFDHEVGKVADEDLATYEVSLKQNAAESLRRLDAWEAEIDSELGNQIERQVAAHKERLARGSRTCPSCGSSVSIENQFCTACGTRLEPAPLPAPTTSVSAACPSCGRSIGPEDRFCPRCGRALGQIAPPRVRGTA